MVQQGLIISNVRVIQKYIEHGEKIDRKRLRTEGEMKDKGISDEEGKRTRVYKTMRGKKKKEVNETR